MIIRWAALGALLCAAACDNGVRRFQSGAAGALASNRERAPARGPNRSMRSQSIACIFSAVPDLNDEPCLSGPGARGRNSPTEAALKAHGFSTETLTASRPSLEELVSSGHARSLPPSDAHQVLDHSG
jgi:hypothetical protein